MKLLHFLLTYKTYLFLAMFGTLTLVAVVNFLHNPYSKQNAKLKRFNKKTLRKPSSIVKETDCLPTEYQRQWRTYVNSRCQQPSSVFEFVKRPQRYLLWFAHFVATTISFVYLMFAIVSNDVTMFAIQMAFLLASVLVVLLTYLVGKVNLSYARKVFGKFLHDLNSVVKLLKGEQTLNLPLTLSDEVLIEGNEQSTQTNTMPSQCKTPLPTAPSNLAKKPVLPNATPTPLQDASVQAIAEGVVPGTNANTQITPSGIEPNQAPAQFDTQQSCIEGQLTTENQGSVTDKAVQILRQKGLNNPRTAEEQRRLNIALNNLLQACCKRR